jgi:SAM-dependent methyltransferase
MVVSSAEVVWHDLECGAYSEDLPLWREFSERSSTGLDPVRILDVGAGAGRVALDLARAGHLLTALDLDPDLLGALAARAANAGLDVETVCADARTFELNRTDFDLCLMPMQTVQLLGGSDERVTFLCRARAHLRDGGLLAMAIVNAIEPFDCGDGEIGPSPERTRIGGHLYETRATRVRALRERILIERERRIDGGAAQIDVIELDVVSASELEREGLQAGFHSEGTREISPTRDHVGGTVVILRA